MFELPSKNTTWNVDAPTFEKCGTLRYSITSWRAGSLPMTSNRTEPPEPGLRSSQNGDTIVVATVDGSAVLLNVVTGAEKLRMPLLPTFTVVRPGSAPANRIGNGEVTTADESSVSVSAVPVITGNSNGTTRAGS